MSLQRPNTLAVMEEEETRRRSTRIIIIEGFWGAWPFGGMCGGVGGYYFVYYGVFREGVQEHKVLSRGIGQYWGRGGVREVSRSYQKTTVCMLGGYF